MPHYIEKEIKRKLNYALQLAKQGFYVFPVIKDSKFPAIKDWPNKATRDQNTIKKWFSQNRNIGIATGKYGDNKMLVVFDIDVKNGKNGKESFKNLIGDNTLPPTMVTTTPTGGKHVVFVSDTPYKNSASLLGDGIDIRSKGGYVLAPGSSIENDCYHANKKTPCRIPSWLEARLRKSTKNKTSPEPGGETPERDTPHALERARAYLNKAEPAIEGQGGDNATFATAATVMDYGISPKKTYELLLEGWNDRCKPSWGNNDLKQKVINASKFRESIIGCNTAEMDFGGSLALSDSQVKDIESKPNPNEPVKVYRPSGLYTIDASEAYADCSLDPLVEKFISQGALCVLYGQSNVGKSFVGLDIARHVASGKPWGGLETEQGAVLYVSPEAGQGILKRVLAFTKDMEKTLIKDFPFRIVPCPVDLLSPKGDIDTIKAFIDELAVDSGFPVRLVVVDTLARSFVGGDENSTQDMSKFISNMDRLKYESNASILILHHSGKDLAKGARGAYALKAGVDTEIEISADDNSVGAIRYINVKKQRDNEIIDSIPFTLIPQVVGQDKKGRDITSCVVALKGSDEFDSIDIIGIMTGMEATALIGAHYAVIGKYTIDGKVDSKTLAAYGHEINPLLGEKSLREFMNDQTDVFELSSVILPFSHYDVAFRSAYTRARDALIAKRLIEVGKDKRWSLTCTLTPA